MKKIISLLVALSVLTSAFAQKDSLIVLNDDVSIVWNCCSEVNIQDSKSDIYLLVSFSNGASFKGLATSQKVLKTVRRTCQMPTHLNELIYCTEIYVDRGVNFPKILLKYIKKKRIYTVEIPLNKIRATFSKHPGGNSKDKPNDPLLLESSKSK